MAKQKSKHDKFMEFWNSPTTKNVATLWAPLFGFPVIVGIAELMNETSKKADSEGRAHFPNLKGNIATLYSATVVANLVSQVGQALGVSITDIIRGRAPVGQPATGGTTEVPLGYP